MTDHALMFVGMGLRQLGYRVAALTLLLYLLAALSLFQLSKECLMFRVARDLRPELFAGAEHYNKEYRQCASAKGQVFFG